MFWRGSCVPGAPRMTQKQSRPAETRFILCSAFTPQYKRWLVNRASEINADDGWHAQISEIKKAAEKVPPGITIKFYL
jgi:hypothetical protein